MESPSYRIVLLGQFVRNTAVTAENPSFEDVLSRGSCAEWGTQRGCVPAILVTLLHRDRNCLAMDQRSRCSRDRDGVRSGRRSGMAPPASAAAAGRRAAASRQYDQAR